MVTSVFIPGSEDISEPLEVRHEVFVTEQGWSEDDEGDGCDEGALHLIVYEDEAPAAAGRIWHDGKSFRIGRLAVKKQYRGQGLGDLALRLLIYKATNSGAESLIAHVQPHAAVLFKKFGFKETGESLNEAGRPHIVMAVAKEDVVYPSECGR